MVENTSRRDPMLHLLGAMSEGNSSYIEGMERAGQRQLISSHLLPAEVDADALAAIGVQLGDPVEGDPLFRHATLPDGWSRQGSDHAMWSYIVDNLGRRRVAIFYKAAFYDRRADARVVSRNAYVYDVMRGYSPLAFDGWITAESFADEALRLAGESDRAAEEYAGLRMSEAADRNRAEAARYRELAALPGEQSHG